MSKKSAIREFIDKDRDVMTEFYDLLEKYEDSGKGVKKLKKGLKALIKQDPFFLDPYLSLAEVHYNEGNKDKADKLVDNAYEKALELILQNDMWPDRLEWGFLENRHVIRAIQQKASNLWEDGNTGEALGIFRKLLRSNPNDNIGARHDILAVRLGLKPDYEKQFLISDKEYEGYLDAIKFHDWFDENYKQFPDEFDWWEKEVKNGE